VGKSYYFQSSRYLLSNLKEAKRLAENYLQDQLKMLEILAELDDSEIHKFNEWFRSLELFTSIPKRMAQLNIMRLNNNMNRET
jgi:hypothetical protein